MMERMKSLKFAGEHVLMQVSWILDKRVGLLWNYSKFVLAMIVSKLEFRLQKTHR
jgi:hypothetical protein